MFELRHLDVLRLCDVETTGFKPQGEICEIGWVDLVYYPEGWRIEGEHKSMFVNPGHPIPPKLTAEVHGISDEMVKDGITPSEARAILAKGAVIHAAHNARFDRQFVQSNLPWICTMEGARKVWPQAPNHKNETLKTFLGIEVEGDAHRAGYDAAVSARILLQLFKHLTIEEMIRISDPGHVPTTMPYGKHKGQKIRELPIDYLTWMLENADLTKGMRVAMENARNAQRAPAPQARPARTSGWDGGF